MINQPEILTTTREGPTVRLRLRVPVGLTVFRGHFEDFPLLPGVIQVDWAIRFGRRHFELPRNFKRLTALKFMRVTPPGAEFDLTLGYNGAGELMFRFADGDAVYSSGRVLFGE